MKRIAQVVLIVAGLFITGALSRASYGTNETGNALLRLSWRTRGEAVQSCRNRTPEELEQLPVHMRTPQVCTSALSAYRLDLRVDGKQLPSTLLHAAGAHADRPIYVFREVSLAAGVHVVDVEYENTLDMNAAPLRYSQTVSAAPGDILLITFDAETGKLFLRRNEVE